MKNSRNRKDSLLHTKSYAFALRVISMNRYLREEVQEFVLSKQILRSGTAIGALIRESEFAQSQADFINKLSIALFTIHKRDFVRQYGKRLRRAHRPARFLHPNGKKQHEEE